MSTIEALVLKLVLAGMGAVGSRIFYGTTAALPAGKGPFLTIVPYQGPPPEGTHNDGPTAYPRPHFQVTVTAQEFPVAMTEAQKAYHALTIVNEEVNGVWFLSATPLQEPFPLGPDHTRRAQVTFNLACRRKA